MSTPRVGSSRSSSRGRAPSARAMMIFCCMPPLNSSRSGSCSRSPGRPRLSAILTAWSPAVSADQRKPRCRPSWLSSRFSMTERSGTMPWRRRSSPTKPTPSLRASSAACCAEKASPATRSSRSRWDAGRRWLRPPRGAPTLPTRRDRGSRPGLYRSSRPSPGDRPRDGRRAEPGSRRVSPDRQDGGRRRQESSLPTIRLIRALGLQI